MILYALQILDQYLKSFFLITVAVTFSSSSSSTELLPAPFSTSHGQFALTFADRRLQFFDGRSLGFEECGDQVFIGNKGMVPANRDKGLDVIADLLPPVDEDPRTLKLIKNSEGYQFRLECP